MIDIREQYPLIDRALCMDIAEDNDIKYPIDNKTRTPIVMTTDFMITKITKDKTEEHVARTVKYLDALENKRTLEKLFIEKHYYNIKNIDWGIVTEDIIPNELVSNIKWAHKAYNLEDIVSDIINREELLFFRYELIETLRSKEDEPLIKCIYMNLLAKYLGLA